MVKPQKLGKNTRMSFSKIEEVLEMPDLLEVQKKSYAWLLEKGIPEVLKDVSPITDAQEKFSISFTGYRFDTTATKYTVEECKESDANYAAPLYVTVQLKNNDTDVIAQKDVYMGDFPVMTRSGTFIINGAERVIISQICRSPGVYYAMDYDKSGKKLYTSTVIPYRGAWLEYETGPDDVFAVRIDKNRKIPVTQLIRALGINSDEDIKSYFGADPLIVTTVECDECTDRANKLGTTPSDEALKEIYTKLRPGEPPLVESAKNLLSMMFFDPKRYDLNVVGRYKYDKKLDIFYRVLGQKVTRDVFSPYTGDCILNAGEEITEEAVELMEQGAVNEVYISIEDGTDELKVFGNGTVWPEKVLGYSLKECGVREKCRFSVLYEILQEAQYDENEVKRLAAARISELAPKHITKDDIFSSINYVVCLSHGIGEVDDIDHLGNRRLRCVGELLQNQLRIGFSRMEKIIKERMSVQDGDTLSPESLINIRPIVTATREFFGSSPLSQFMDQNNPLAELTHKRRLSALGPGGLSRDRASFDVRDVHYTHYGRICPIETPEGQNIGLISYLATYAKISEYGFIQAPYRRIDKETGIVTTETVYMTADEEDNYIIAQANEPLDSEHRFVRDKVTARHMQEIIEVEKTVPDFMDVSPKMAVSVATACIPFLENDDNSRALMGSNMQKQAVPLLVNESPIVGTGMEFKAAIDSGVMVIAEEGGQVESVSADEIVIKQNDGRKRVYRLTKFKRSNQSTCINQKPIVDVGDIIEKGDIIADGPATCNGEVSLGKNALIGFMTWEGYNYEDAVLLNENLVRNDTYTSIHIEEYSHEARDTKLGPEEITREIPNVGEDALKDLDENGIVRLGTEVRSGDILVGKVTPKGETEQTAEERLLHAIFGDKAREVRDTSLRVPHGAGGIVVDVKVFSREHHDEMQTGVNKVVRVYIGQKRKISVGDKMAGRHGNKGVVSRILPPEDMPFMADGTPLDIVLNPMGVPSRMNIGQVLEVHLGIAAERLGFKVMTPVFDGAKEADITALLKEAGMSETGKMTLYDGRTGEPFDNPVTVGIMYYLKLHHLVDDKIHARSTGPYSLVTQQPLGGKAQFGGQRFGEMEVWALEAYGAAYMLQEILTVKSDDVEGRVDTYEAIIKGENVPTPGVPEAFRVLVKELRALCLDIRVYDHDDNEVELSLVEGASKPGDYMNREKYYMPEELNAYDTDTLDGFSIKDENGDDDDSFYANSEEEVFGDGYDDEDDYE